MKRNRYIIFTKTDAPPALQTLKMKPPGLIRVAVENHLPLDLFKIYGIIYLSWQMPHRGRLTAGAWC
ncbi:TPA: hypothetical protein ACFOXL_001190, partial [Neisseria meningitidis]